jgi:hypothetical protein
VLQTGFNAKITRLASRRKEQSPRTLARACAFHPGLKPRKRCLGTQPGNAARSRTLFRDREIRDPAFQESSNARCAWRSFPVFSCA